VLNDGRQMRAWSLHYDDATGLSRLDRVERFGTQNARPFPVVFTFAYTGGLGDCAGEACQVPRMGTIARGLPSAFAEGDADFIDINGDSLPDVLDSSGDRHTFALNLGEFEPAVVNFNGSTPSGLVLDVPFFKRDVHAVAAPDSVPTVAGDLRPPQRRQRREGQHPVVSLREQKRCHRVDEQPRSARDGGVSYLKRDPSDQTTHPVAWLPAAPEPPERPLTSASRSQIATDTQADARQTRVRLQYGGRYDRARSTSDTRIARKPGAAPKGEGTPGRDCAGCSKLGCKLMNLVDCSPDSVPDAARGGPTFRRDAAPMGFHAHSRPLGSQRNAGPSLVVRRRDDARELRTDLSGRRFRDRWHHALNPRHPCHAGHTA
jgi:hypothetical protein